MTPAVSATTASVVNHGTDQLNVLEREEKTFVTA
jgi:hypothetical protein